MTALKYALNVFIVHIRILHIETWFWASKAWDNNAAWWPIRKFFVDPVTLTAPLLCFQCTPNAHNKEKLFVWVLSESLISFPETAFCNLRLTGTPSGNALFVLRRKAPI
jgi:hypothetical protein